MNEPPQPVKENTSRVTTEARTFGMIARLILGYGVSEIAAEYRLSRRWVSTLLNKPGTREAALKLQKQIADRLIAAQVARLAGRTYGRINFTNLMKEICIEVDKRGRKNTDSSRDASITRM